MGAAPGGLDLGAKKEGGPGRQRGGVVECGLALPTEAAGEGNTREAQVTQRSAGSTSFGPLESGEATVESLTGEGHKISPHLAGTRRATGEQPARHTDVPYLSDSFHVRSSSSGRSAETTGFKLVKGA
jgi:hypothetical protein